MSDNISGKRLSGDLKGRLIGTSIVYPMGNLTSLVTKQEVESDPLIGTGKHNHGQVIDSFNKNKPIEVGFKFNTFNKLGMSRILMGDVVALDTTIKTFTDEEQDVNYTGEIKLVNSDIDPDGFEIKDSTGATIDAKHYTLNAVMGFLAFHESDDLALSEGDVVGITGKTKGSKGYQIDASTKKSYSLELWLDGEELVSEKDFNLHFPRVDVSSDGDVEWMSKDWWESALKGAVVVEGDKPPYTYKEFE